MVASVLQLYSKGLEDVYLTQTPDINIFKYMYKKYVNFATELVRLTFNDYVDFGKTTSCDVPKRGNLLTNLFLRIRLPRLVCDSGTFLSWCDNVGYAMFQEGISLEIGGLLVDTFYPEFWDIYECFMNSDNNSGSNLMTLKSDSYISTRYNATRENDLVIPLRFWFTRDYKLGLPIGAMPNQSIKLKFKFKHFEDCINYDGLEPSDYSFKEAEIFAEYVYLDETVLTDFYTTPYEYIGQRVLYNGKEHINANASDHSIQLLFNGPCKELVFSCIETNSISNNDHFNYSNLTTDSNLIQEIGFSIEGSERIKYTPEVFFRLGYPFMVHQNVPLKYVYTLPFSIKPAVSQPSGSLSFSSFSSLSLNIKMVPQNPECILRIFGVFYSRITIKNGVLNVQD